MNNYELRINKICRTLSNENKPNLRHTKHK